jgi:hypothetical protein
VSKNPLHRENVQDFFGKLQAELNHQGSVIDKGMAPNQPAVFKIRYDGPVHSP